MVRLVALKVGGEPNPWKSIGLRFDGFLCSLGDVALQVDGDGAGLVGWTLAADRDAIVDIDGIETTLVATRGAPTPDPMIGDHRIVGLDHVVVTTDDLDRTCSAIEENLGLSMRRERDAGSGTRQRFFKLDNSIIEVVSGPHVKQHGAALWGMVISVEGMIEWADSLGPELTSAPKPATQPGRFISTVKSQVGLGVPFAVMTPHVA